MPAGDLRDIVTRVTVNAGNELRAYKVIHVTVIY